MMADTSNHLSYQFGEGVEATDILIQDENQTVDHAISAINGRHPISLLMITRIRRVMQLKSSIISGRRRISSSFPGCAIVESMADDNYVYALLDVKQITLSTIVQSRLECWILAESPSILVLMQDVELLNILFDQNKVLQKVKTILSFVEMCARYWPWDRQKLIQCFYKARPKP